ncbi:MULTISPECIES: D-alanyl-D-alanine carboxypeptidase family protein [unclassified Paenibacillus]|uniref:M15 family metallopeptidase n=1 Tax=unclassified Paenibacillus TaxID=185978 RepID=UPI001E49323B|nr:MULTISPECIES: M15 family metallopeptidase [unclassified Paenibacillus]CAH0119462.1 Putative carboxypeptidase YodJ [Paenibacillus sp. CECT 9249]
MKKAVFSIIILGIAIFIFIEWQKEQSFSSANFVPDSSAVSDQGPESGSDDGQTGEETAEPDSDDRQSDKPLEPEQTSSRNPSETREAITDPDNVAVLVNKQFALPDQYEPDDLVYPDVHFIFKEKIDKRKMRKEAAEALQELFAGAAKDGIHLGGVSAYRSQATQKSLFNRYVERDGKENAMRYSAVPGHSEHQTGLAIDVSGSDGKCAASDCFAGTPEADWIAQHAPEYGFIIRYPEGKEAITGYKYEPWHIRYVGVDIAKDIAAQNLTLEEYFNAVPVQQEAS